jgi:ABC-2 type transport system ATP-binding protein
MITINDLTISIVNPKSILTRNTILDKISCSIESGCTFGIVGRAGSGKTFILKALLGLIAPDSGEILIDNKTPNEYLRKNNIGYLAKEPYFHKYLKAEEVLIFYSKILEPTKSKREQLINELINKVHLNNAKNSIIYDYTEGMLRRLGIAKAILHNPKILLLDEPLYGLDPVGRNVVLEILTELKQLGTTIVYCSHNLYDIEALCDEIMILDKGKIIKQGTIQNVLPNSIAGIELIIEIPKQKKLKEIEHKISIIDISIDQIKIFVPEISELHEILYFMQANNIEVRAIKTIRQSLEKYFIKLVPESNI